MRSVFLVEWACSGGLENPAHVNETFFREGVAMLQSLCDIAAASGNEIRLVLDGALQPHLPSAWNVQNRKGFQVHWLNHTTDGSRLAFSEVLEEWKSVAEGTDSAMIVAPECDGILEQSVSRMLKSNSRLLNCKGHDLHVACDKLLTSEALSRAKIPHPPTQLATELSENWFDEVSSQLKNHQWVVKPRDGAGCDGLRIVDRDHLRQIKWDAGHVVQPYLEGEAVSCSAIVSSDGSWTWCPLMSQELTVLAVNAGTQRLEYHGGRLLTSLAPPFPIFDQLERVLSDGALGWIGIDLLYQKESASWFVIEVNPRCTTSIVELSQKHMHLVAPHLFPNAS